MLIALAGAVVVVTFLMSAALTPVTRAVARWTGMMDAPTGRKDHAAPTPLLGGSAIMASVLIVSLVGLVMGSVWATRPPTWLPQDLAAHLPGVVARTPMAICILAGALILHVLGLIDDRHHLGAVAKLAVQIIVAAGVVVFADVRVLTMAGPTLSIAATILWLVGIINAFNFLDNADGLAVGVAAIGAAALLAATVQMEQMFVTAWLCVLLGAMLGYLPYNYPPASTFMGDSGSLVIGYFLGVLSCLTTYVRPDAPVSLGGLLMPVVLMAVPLYDMASVVFLRLREGESIWRGDQRHFSHRLIRRGMTPTAAILTIYLCTAGTAIAASLLPHVDNVGAGLVAGQTVLILLIIAVLEYGGRSGNGATDPSPDPVDQRPRQ